MTAKYFICKRYNCLPTFQRPEGEAGNGPRGKVIYFAGVKIGTVALEESKKGPVWTARNLNGKKVSARTGAWWKCTELLVGKFYDSFIEENGWDAYVELVSGFGSVREIEVAN